MYQNREEAKKQTNRGVHQKQQYVGDASSKIEDGGGRGGRVERCGGGLVTSSLSLDLTFKLYGHRPLIFMHHVS